MNSSILKNGLLSLALTTALITPSFGIHKAPNDSVIHTVQKDKIKVTINKNTTDSEFKEIVKTLKKHNINAKFSGIKRNKKNEIIAVKIKLEDDNGNESNTSLSSDNPISSINLGAEKNSLYITSSDSKNFSFNGTHSLSKHFDFSFDDDEHKMTINGKTFDFDEIKNQIKDAFVFEEDSDGKRVVIKLNNFDFDFDNNNEEEDSDKENHEWTTKQHSQKFHFVDDPEIEKLIMIDGKKADFNKLDELAKSNKLKSVDFLKPDTAKSLYGKKAKEGAIIATTK
jgi:hypothetical protein